MICQRTWLIGLALITGVIVFAATEFIAADAREGLPQFQRKQADRHACAAAVAGVAKLPSSPKVASGECIHPKVTPMLHEPGRLIVTLVEAEQPGQATRRKAFSVLLDGRETDAWRVLEIQLTPDKLVLEVLEDALASRAAIDMAPASQVQSALR